MLTTYPSYNYFTLHKTFLNGKWNYHPVICEFVYSLNLNSWFKWYYYIVGTLYNYVAIIYYIL